MCVDVEPDSPQLGGKPYNFWGGQSWRGVEEGIPAFMRLRDKIENKFDYEIPLTWFFRSDDQLKMIYGDAAWMLNKFKGVVKLLLDKKDEVGWHGHTWRWSPENKSWYQEINDKKWIIACYKEGFSSFIRAAGFKPFCFRAGWCFHNNVSLGVLDKLGVVVDLSAMPGIKNLGEKNTKDGSIFYGYADWQRTNSYPYFPSKDNYQVTKEDNYALLEIPMTTCHKPLISFIHQLLPFRVESQIQKAKPKLNLCKYILSPTQHPYIFKKGFQETLNRFTSSKIVPIITAFHADQLLFEKCKKHLAANIEQMFLHTKAKRFQIHFSTVSKATKFLSPLVKR